MQELKNNTENYSELNLTIKDNFLEDEFFKDLHKSIIFKKWDPIENIYLTTGKHVWHSCKVENNLINFFKEKIENKFNVKIKNFLYGLTYTMVSNIQQESVHYDKEEPGKNFNAQFLYYVNGNTELTNGTGFYTKIDDVYQLSTHVGFVENRALLFKNKVVHSPLKFLSKDNKPRFSIIAFLLIE